MGVSTGEPGGTRDEHALEVIVIRTDDSLRDDVLTGEYWRKPSSSLGAPFFQVLRWTDASPSFPAPGPVRYDLLDRGVDLGPSLHQWAERVLASGKGSDHERSAALSLILDRHSKKALDCLARHPYLTEQELAVLLGVHHARMPQILGDLQRYGLISSLGEVCVMTTTRPATIRHHFATHEGLRLLARTEAVPPLRHGEHAGLAVETSAKGRGGSRMRNLRRNFDHTLGVNAVVAHLAFDAQRAGHKPPRLLNEAQAAEHFRYYDRPYWIRPDAAGVYYLGDSSHPFLLEYDRGKMRRRDYLRKLAGLTAYFASERDQRSYGSGLTVLVVSESYGGEGRFADAVLAGQALWGVELPLLLTTDERIRRNAHGLLGPIWRTAAATARRRWIGADRPGQPSAYRPSSLPVTTPNLSTPS